MNKQFLIAVFIYAFIGTGSLFAEEGHDHSDHKGSMMEDHEMMEHEHEGDMDKSKAVEVGNKVCPVSGEKVGGDMGEVVKYEYKGKIYNLCCTMCAKDFKKDPEKYSKIAEEEARQYQEDHAGHGDESEEGHEHTGDGHDHSQHH